MTKQHVYIALFAAGFVACFLIGMTAWLLIKTIQENRKRRKDRNKDFS